MAIGKRVAAASTSERAFPRLALILIAAISVLWGVNWPFMKLAVGELTPWTFRVLSVYGAGPVLLIIAVLSGERTIPTRREIPALLLVSFFTVTCWHMLTAYGLDYVGGGRAAIIAFTMPIWAMILSVLFLDERFDKRRIAALACGMIGIALLTVQGWGQMGASPIGTGLILLAAMAWGAGTVGTKAFAWTIGTGALSGWFLIAGGVPILIVWLFLEAPGDFSRLTATGVFAMCYVVFVALVFCFTSYLRIVRLVPASVAAISTLAIPVVGVISSGLILGEQIGWPEITALLFVLGAMSLVLLPQNRSRSRNG